MERGELSQAEQALLRALLVKPLTPSQAAKRKGGDEAVRALRARGLVAEIAPAPGPAKRRAAPKLELTADGRASAARLPAAKPARTPRPKLPTTAELLAAIQAVHADLRTLRDELRGRPGPPATTSTGPSAPPAAADAGRMDEALRTALRDLDGRGRYGGLVPIPELRRALAPLGLSRAALDAHLLDRERRRTIELKVANDPRQVPAPEEGLRVDGRGLLYYVVAR